LIGVFLCAVKYLLLLEISNHAYAEQDSCKSNDDCVIGGMCHKSSRKCICENGSSAYPSCSIIEGNSCKAPCSNLQYCDGRSKHCLCLYGGMTKDTCCREQCGKYQVCSGGRCKCAFGTRKGERCRRCMEVCGRNEVCLKRKRDDKYVCVKKCKSGFKRVKGRCVPVQQWSQWGAWSKCSKSCGSGAQTRTRVCQPENAKCIGEAADTRKCHASVGCTGEWGAWKAWSKCSKSCDGGTRTRTRTCPDATFCPDHPSEKELCETDPCVGTWGPWTSWSKCTKSCGGGNRKRTRKCQNGVNCEGFERTVEACNNDPCEGTWAAWGQWSACSVTCDGGIRQRSRTCPSGLNCLGLPTEKMGCGAKPCIKSVDCGWCRFKKPQGQCRTREVSVREPNCPAKQGNGAACVGDSTKVTIRRPGAMIQQDFHSHQPEANRFYAKCTGGCITIHKVVHWCRATANIDEDLRKVKEVCEGKEVCGFTPAPSFFGPKDCLGIKKTWVVYSCIGGSLINRHIHGQRCIFFVLCY